MTDQPDRWFHALELFVAGVSGALTTLFIQWMFA